MHLFLHALQCRKPGCCSQGEQCRSGKTVLLHLLMTTCEEDKAVEGAPQTAPIRQLLLHYLGCQVILRPKP